jgi:hypothetical protein
MPIHITRRAALAGLGAGWWATAQAQGEAPADSFAGLSGARVRLAPVEEARRLLMADDDWMGITSEFQRRAVMGSIAPVTLEAFKRWNGDAATPFDEAWRQRWLKALQTLAPGWNALRLPLPAEVWLVHSNGQESAHTPYTRQNAVVMPDQAYTPPEGDTFLLAHELWHVVSRQAPALASALYAELGFEPMAPLELPAAWARIHIANPDAPAYRHAMRLKVQGRQAWVTPVLVAARTILQRGETFFHVAEPRLVEVEPGPPGGASRAVLRPSGEPVWHAVDGDHDYLQRLGGNTEYVIHPEETLAENIAYLVTGAPARNKALLARLKTRLDARA